MPAAKVTRGADERVPGAPAAPGAGGSGATADWHRRVIDRSLGPATQKSIDRGASLIRAAATLLARSNGEGFTVQEVADEAGHSLRTLYQYFESKDDLLLAVLEEAMRTYARWIVEAIADLEDPLDRLAGAIVAASRMPERSNPAVDISLARLRLELGQVDPQLLSRSHQPVISVFEQLHREAVAAGHLRRADQQGAVYLLAALNGAYIISQTLGNEYGLELPDHESYARFCLRGLGAQLDEGWFPRINARIFPDGPPKGRGRGRTRSVRGAPAPTAGR